ncbi:MAG TPA: hypothetical protein DDX29_01270 [Clostridiales bacterium]|nr:hypothetical protein [Clostridiales bacterium]
MNRAEHIQAVRDFQEELMVNRQVLGDDTMIKSIDGRLTITRTKSVSTSLTLQNIAKASQERERLYKELFPWHDWKKEGEYERTRKEVQTYHFVEIMNITDAIWIHCEECRNNDANFAITVDEKHLYNVCVTCLKKSWLGKLRVSQVAYAGRRVA